MIGVNQLKGLSALNWVCICLFSLNILVLPFVFLVSAESNSQDEDPSYPTLTLYSSDWLPSNNFEASLGKVYASVKLKGLDDVSAVLAMQSLKKPIIVASEKNQTHEHSSEDVKEIYGSKFQRACYKVGPLASNEERIKWQNLLEMKGMFASVAYNQLKENFGYWVFMPPLRSRALGRLKVEELKLKGFQSAVLLDRIDPINAVSLGVYDTQKDAHKLLLKAQSLGFSVKMDVRSQGVDSVWLMVEIARQKSLESMDWVGFLRSAPHLSSHSLDCT